MRRGSWGIVAGVSSPNIDPGLRELADLARRIELRVVGVSTRTRDAKTVLIIELADATRERHEALAEALRAHRREHGLTTEFLIFNTTTGFSSEPVVRKKAPT